MFQKKILDLWPVKMPNNYLGWVNEPQTAEELESLRRSVNRGKPYGGEIWMNSMIKKFNLNSTSNTRGRPKKGS